MGAPLLLPRAGPSLQHLDLQSLAAGHRIAHCHSREEKSPSPTGGAPTRHPANRRQCPVVFHPVGWPVPSPAAPSPDPRGRRATAAGADGAVCAHAEGTRRALAEHTSPTRLPRSRGILPFRMPASGRWHPHCHSSRSRSLLATAATVQLPDPKGKWPGRAGSSGGRRWKRWPKPRFDLSPISRGRSPPSLRGQLGSFLSTTLEQPSVCGNSPEAVQNKVRFRCFSPPGIAWPRQSLLPAPQFPHPVHREVGSKAQTNVVFYPRKRAQELTFSPSSAVVTQI